MTTALHDLETRPDWNAKRNAWRAPPVIDRRPIYEWVRDNLEELPESYAIRGRFDVRNSPWLIEPFHSMQDPGCRRTSVLKAVQSGGTLLAELTTLWRIINDPGPCTITFQSDDMAALEAKTRLWPLLERCPPIARILPRPGPMRTQQEIFFGGFFLILNSANAGDQQSQSVRYKINDEIWMPKWAPVYIDACARVTAFEQQGTSHILDISQGGEEGQDSNGTPRPDIASESFRQGTSEEWSARCRGCGRSHPIAFELFRDDGKTRAGVVWADDARDEDGRFNIARATETVRFVCPHCGHEHDDTDATRAHWRKTGHYLATNATAPRWWRSFHWEAPIAHPMHALVAEFCNAENTFLRTGDEEPRKKFRQKRRALSWLVKRTTIELSGKSASGYRYADVASATPLPGEIARHMTIDKQQSHWWYEVGAWVQGANVPEYRQLAAGRAETRDALRQRQQLYGVHDWAVGQDRRYKPSEVDQDCVAFGWSGLAGATTKRKRWPMRDEATGQMINYPYSPTMLSPVQAGVDAPYVEFDPDYFKDILSNAIAGVGGLRWVLPDDVSPVYLEHLKGESKQEVRPGVWEWREVKVNAPNHLWDTSVMQLVVAMVRGIVRFDPPKEWDVKMRNAPHE